MQKTFMTLLFCLIFGAATASAQKKYCFQNDGLKLQQKVSLTVTGNKIEGTFESGGYETANSAETFDFTGLKNGNFLTVKFAGKPPYETAPGATRIIWTLRAGELKIPTYGKNYNTNKYSAYTASFEKCKND